MLRIIDFASASASNSSPQTCSLAGVSYVSGDMLLIQISQDGGGTTIAPDATSVTAGWAMVGTQAQSGACRQAFAWKIAASSSDTDPVFSGDADNWVFTVVVLRGTATLAFGASPTSGVDFIRTDWNAAWNFQSGSLTTGADDTFLIYGACFDTDNDSSTVFKMLPSGCHYLTQAVDNSNGIRQMLGYFPGGPSGTVAPVATWYCNDTQGGTQQGGNTWVLAIRGDGSGEVEPAVDAQWDPLFFFGNYYRSDLGAWEDIDNFPDGGTTTSILGINLSSAANSIGAQSDLTALPESLSVINTSDAAEVWAGAGKVITAKNMENKVFILQWQINARSVIGANGWCVGFSDGTNYVVYQLSPLDSTLPTEANLYTAIALGNATSIASSGTIDWTAITRVGFFIHRDGTSSAGKELRVKNAFLMGTAEIVGGGADEPATSRLLALLTKALGYPNFNTLQGANQTLAKQSVRIGDGNITTYFDASAASLEFPFTYDADDSIYRAWNATAGAVSLDIFASAGDTLNLTAGIFATTVPVDLTINSSYNTSASESTAGSSFVGYRTVTWKTGVTCNLATFKSCGELFFKGSDLTNVIINDTTATDAAVSFDADGGSMTDSTVDLTGATCDYHIELGTAVTGISLIDVTFAGTPGVDKIHVLKTTGTVTITIDGTTSLSAGDVDSEGATIVIAAPSAAITISNPNLADGTKVLLMNVTQDSELDIGTVSGGTGYSFGPVTVGVGESIEVGDIIRIYGTWASGDTYKENYTEAGVATLSDLTFIGEQSDWMDANNLATDGSAQTEFTADYPNVQVDINSPDNYWQGAKFAAWYVYNQTTDNGIRNYFGSIESSGAVWTILTSIADVYLDNVNATSISQSDNVYIQRDDGAYPQANPTSGGGGIGMKQTGQVFVVTVAGASVITGDTDTVIDALLPDIQKALTVPKFLALK